MSKLHVSVIIPNLDSPLIGRTLAALRNQRFDGARIEVLVVGRDGPGLVQEDEQVRWIDTGRATSAAFNRNLGMQMARGDIFCFTDADCEPAPDWLQRLTGALDAPARGVVGGGVVFDRGNYWSICDNVSWFNQFLATAPRGARLHLPTLNLAVRRAVVETAGPMDEAYPLAAGEDTAWTERMRSCGFELYFEPDARVTHVAQRTTFAALWRHGYNYGRYSPKVGERRGAVSGSLPRGLQRPWLVYGAAPVLGAAAMMRALRRAQTGDAWRIWPGIWLSKIAWCMGAAQSLRDAGHAKG